MTTRGTTKSFDTGVTMRVGVSKIYCILLVIVGVLVLSGTKTYAAERPPNIIMVFIDDMGWGDFSCFGNTAASTPAIDQLADEGVRFTQFYVNSPICSPSRVALTTGQYPHRWRITSFLNNRRGNTKRGMAQWLDPKAPTLARQLKAHGYSTGHFGKWHMGGQRADGAVAHDVPLVVHPDAARRGARPPDARARRAPTLDRLRRGACTSGARAEHERRGA